MGSINTESYSSTLLLLSFLSQQNKKPKSVLSWAVNKFFSFDTHNSPPCFLFWASKTKSQKAFFCQEVNKFFSFFHWYTQFACMLLLLSFLSQQNKKAKKPKSVLSWEINKFFSRSSLVHTIRLCSMTAGSKQNKKPKTVILWEVNKFFSRSSTDTHNSPPLSMTAGSKQRTLNPQTVQTVNPCPCANSEASKWQLAGKMSF